MAKTSIIYSATLTFFSLNACSSSEKYTINDGVEGVQPSSQELDDLIKEVGSDMEGNTLGNDTASSIPLEINQEVERALRYFIGQDHERFQRFLSRGEYYRPLVETKLREVGVPLELYYLAMIESGFETHAYSRASAVGLWQFIKPTAQRYGLVVSPYVDERRDPVRATLAAAAYLRDLHNVFQSWFLAMAAYNAGESRIMGAIMRAKTRDFWELARKKALPSETMHYVPKFIAAAMIGRHPEKFGFSLSSTDKIPELVSADVPGRATLSDIASTLKISLETIKKHNPHFRSHFAPPHKNTYKMWIPAELQTTYAANSPQLGTLNLVSLSRKSKSHSNSNSRSTPSFHVVRRGENLTLIARKYNVSIADIKSINSLKSDRLIVGKRLRLQPIRTSKRSVVRVKTPKTYKVRRGDNLETIARRFNVNVKLIKQWNRLTRSRIYAGQVLHVGPRGS